jgi:uncharacterized protein YcnI
MRCSGWSSLAISICSALALTGAASAHVFPTPQFIASGSTGDISLDVPNERKEPMTGFTITAGEGLTIEHAHPNDGWAEELSGSTASWTGGSIPHLAQTTFGISLRADAPPGPVAMQAEQLYDSGAVVRWPVSLTVVPAEETSSQNLALAAVVGLMGLLVVAAVAMVAWRRRAPADVSPP